MQYSGVIGVLTAVNTLELSRIIFLPNKKLYGAIITAINRPHMHASIANLVAKYNILPVNFFAVSKGSNVEITLFLDFSSAEISLERLSKEILAIKGVSKVDHIKPLFKGLIVDTHHFPLQFVVRELVFLGNLF